MAAELKIGIGAETSDLAQGLKNAEAQISAFVNKVVNIGKIGEQLSSIGQKMTAGLTLPIVALGGSAIKAYGDIQSLQKGLEAVMGSASSASAEFNKLKEIAKLPGLGMEEAVKGSINLQSIGIDAEKSRNILLQFGNAVATVGKGRAEFERAIYGVQQLANTDFPLGEDLNIIKDALPQVSNLLKEAFGTSRSDELAKMGISSQQVLDVIINGLEKLPRVTGGINGAFENMSDSVKTSLGRIGKVIDDNFDISGIIDKITSFIDKAVSAFESLNPAVQKTILVVGGLVAAAGPLIAAVGAFLAMLPTMLTGIGAIGTALTALTGPIGLVTAGLIGIVTAVVANWGKITPYLVRTANNFIQLYNESQTFRSGVLAIGFAFESIYAVIKSFAISAYSTLKSFGKGVLNLFEGVSLMIRGAFNMKPEMIAEGWAKANAKVALSFDDLGARISGVENKYNNLLANKKPLKFVTEADFNISSGNIAEKTEKTVVNEVTKGVKKANDKLKDVKIELPDIKPIETGKFAGFMDDLGNEVENWWNIDDAHNAFSEKIKATMDATSAALNAAVDKSAVAKAKIAENVAYIKETFTNLANDIENAIGSAIADTVTDMFSAIGEAIGSGGNVIAAMGQSLLNSFSGFLSNMGKMMAKYGGLLIAYGIAEKVLKFSPDPAKKIAAGAALVAIGSAMSLVAGAIKGASSGGSSGGGSYSTSSGNSSPSYYSNYSSGGNSGGEVVFRISGNDLVGVLSRQQDKNTRLGG